ncbi:MAG TPA: HAD-IIIA family hydrolase [Candidatus Binataceae bacterium]|nr:HAD-IIIA family hydrolase [Candidatus Binataceae bacterium]
MSESNGNAALFFDLAGTLVRIDETRSIPRDAGGNLIIELLPGVADKLRPIHDHLVLIVTNQAGIRRGWFTREQVEAGLRALDDALGDIITAWEICPHLDEDNCRCRKPKGGMITELAELYGVDLKSSTMVGDQEIDEQAARAAGVGRFVYAKDFFGWD